MTTIEDFFGNIGRRRTGVAVPPYPHAQPAAGEKSTSSGRLRRFVVRVVIVLLLLMMMFLVRFIPDSLNPFVSLGLVSTNAANGSSGGEPGPVPGGASTADPASSDSNGTNQGIPGPRGSDGAPGSNGADGRDGAKGADGQDGAQGETGPMGPTGSLGQANSDISACDDNIVVSLRSSWSSGSDAFHVSRVILSDVGDSCAGLYLGFDLLDSSGESLAHVEVDSLEVIDGVVTLSASDYVAFATVRSVDVARVALEIAS